MRANRRRLSARRRPKRLDLVAMRSWRGKRRISRALILIACLDRLVGPDGLKEWLESPNPRLGNSVPIALLKAGKWKLIADMIDDMLTGSPT
jgi:Protein of unknown function (DUF2384).